MHSQIYSGLSGIFGILRNFRVEGKYSIASSQRKLCNGEKNFRKKNFQKDVWRYKVKVKYWDKANFGSSSETAVKNLQ